MRRILVQILTVKLHPLTGHPPELSLPVGSLLIENVWGWGGNLDPLLFCLHLQRYKRIETCIIGVWVASIELCLT